NNCDDCTPAISLPFTYTFYGQTYSTANVSSNGNLQFGSNSNEFAFTALPDSVFNDAIFAYAGDLTTTTAGDGIFTSVSGTAPDRIFNIEWRAHDLDFVAVQNFEIRLYEDQTRFDVIYGTINEIGGTGCPPQCG